MIRAYLSIVLGVLGSAAIVATPSVVGCSSPQQAGANTVSIASAVCLADETAASLIPPGAIQQAAQDIALVCQDVPVSSIIAFVESLIGSQVDAGATPAAAYRPSPHVMAAHAAKVRDFGGPR